MLTIHSLRTKRTQLASANKSATHLVGSACALLLLSACGGGGGGSSGSGTQPGTQAQTITFTGPAAQVMGVSPPALEATSSSGLPVSFLAGPSTICTVSGTALTLVSDGDCTVTASQPGDSSYASAADVVRTFTIAPAATPVITTETRSISCPVGQTGSINQSRTVSTVAGVSTPGAWTNVSDTCVTAPAVSSARVATISLAQSHVLPVTDSALVLVAGKQALILVGPTTTNPSEPKPSGTVRIETSTGTLVELITLTPPTGAIGSSAPTSPSFTTSYSAVIPANRVVSGMRMVVGLDNGQLPTTFAPRVGGGVPITLVAVPVRMSGTDGQPLASTAASDLEAVMPMRSVNYQVRSAYTSGTALPSSESGWSSALSSVLFEMATLKTMEAPSSSTTYYFGFVPKSSFGVTGVGFVPGNAAVGWDRPASPVFVLETLIHELGHNLSLPHAPCGGPASPDASYPYTNAQLGSGSRFIWGFNAKTNTFIDPTDTNRHDIMSYCTGNTFSDYNYRNMQVYLTPADASIWVARDVSTLSLAKVSSDAATGPVPLLLIGGEITANGVAFKPTKTITGEPLPIQAGAYTLRIVSDSGTVDYPFSPLVVDHDATTRMFLLSVPHPGSISSISVLKGDVAIGSVTAVAPAAATLAPAPLARSASMASTSPQVDAAERSGVLTLTWDSAKYPYLSVVHVGNKRLVLGQDLVGGVASIKLDSLPAGGSFEFSLSDGINTALIKTSR